MFFVHSFWLLNFFTYWRGTGCCQQRNQYFSGRFLTRCFHVIRNSQSGTDQWLVPAVECVYKDKRQPFWLTSASSSHFQIVAVFCFNIIIPSWITDRSLCVSSTSYCIYLWCWTLAVIDTIRDTQAVCYFRDTEFMRGDKAHHSLSLKCRESKASRWSRWRYERKVLMFSVS